MIPLAGSQKAQNEVANSTKNSTGKTVTKITVKYNCGFPNNLFIRGEGIQGLNWEKGVALKNVKADEWTWETDKPFNKAKFKILLNDMHYENGENHIPDCGKQITCTPKF